MDIFLENTKSNTCSFIFFSGQVSPNVALRHSFSSAEFHHTMTMGDSNKNLYAKMIVDVVLGPVLERVQLSQNYCHYY